MKQLILASSSPRRKEILSKTRLSFIVEASQFEEDMSLPLSPKKMAEEMSRGKAEAVVKKHSDAVVIGADSFVVCNGLVLGKPKDRADAKRMLQLQQGQKIGVITGVTIIDTDTKKKISFADETLLFIKKLSDSEIDHYLDDGEYKDKAGAFAMQELGATFIERVEGDFFGAVGLPIAKLTEILKEFGIFVLQ